MNTLLITYDLIKQGQNYETLYEKIKSLGDWWHCLDSNWIIKTKHSAVEVRDFLNRFIDNNDKLLVVQLSRSAAWTGFNKDCSDWLKANL